MTATHFLERGSVTDFMSQLGHSNLETTRIYAASVSERRRATVLALDFPAPAKLGPSEDDDAERAPARDVAASPAA